MWVAIALACWCALSVLFAVVIGKGIAFGSHRPEPAGAALRAAYSERLDVAA
jgi:hypothetical protein